MTNTTHDQDEQQRRYHESVNQLIAIALGYVAGADGQRSVAEAELAGRILSRLTDSEFTPQLVTAMWNRLPSDSNQWLHHIASQEQYLSQTQKEFLVYACSMIADQDGRLTEGELRAVGSIASVLQLDNAALQSILDTARRDAARYRASAGPTPPPQPPPRPPAGEAAKANAGTRPWSGWWVVLGIGLAALVLWLVTDYQLDRIVYDVGFDAYEVGDCKTAKYVMDRLLGEPMLGTTAMYEFSGRAKEIQAQCDLLSRATELQHQGQSAEAFNTLLKATTSKELPGFLVAEASTRLESLVAQAQPTALANHELCRGIEQLQSRELLTDTVTMLPGLYLECGKLQEAKEEHTPAFENFLHVFREFPNYIGVSLLEEALLASPVACGRSAELLETEALKLREEFMGRFFLHCGQGYEAVDDFKNAVRVYREFVDNYPEHNEVKGAKEALASNLFLYATSLGAEEIPRPSKTGTVGGGKTTIVIRNDSPDVTRISFSGPEALIEEIAACATCQEYLEDGPESCPDRGPLSTFTLMPGRYNVVVESSTDADVTPYVGTWNLEEGTEYSECFFIVQSIGDAPRDTSNLP